MWLHISFHERTLQELNCPAGLLSYQSKINQSKLISDRVSTYITSKILSDLAFLMKLSLLSDSPVNDMHLYTEMQENNR